MWDPKKDRRGGGSLGAGRAAGFQGDLGTGKEVSPNWPLGRDWRLWQRPIPNILRTWEKSKNWFPAKINGTKPMRVFTACRVLEISIMSLREKQN